MKKQFVAIFFTVINIFCFKDLKAQCSNYNSYSALDTYWHYRYRLINYFMKVGEGTWYDYGFGQSLPAYIRNQSPLIESEGCSNYLWYSDVGRNL